MKIVIDIPEKTYKYAKKYANSPILSVRDIDRCMDAISKGEIEQEPILDKIRSEMFKERLSHSGTGEEVIQAYADGLKKGIEIIDKYRGESYGDAERDSY